MTISVIVAAAENNVIGIKNDLPWDLPDDLQHFKEVTSGSPVVMGKGTFLSLPGGPLPNRRNIVIAMEEDYTADGCEVVHNLADAIGKFEGSDEEVFIIGGGMIYRQFMDPEGEFPADTLYLTRVHTEIEGGEVFFPEVTEDEWEEVERSETHPADERHEYAFTFLKYKRKP